MRRRVSLIVAMTLLASLLGTGVASANHGDSYQGTESGRCVAVPEMAGGNGGRGTALDTGNAAFQSEGSTCDEGDGVQPPYGDNNPFPECTDVPGLSQNANFEDDCGGP